MVIELTQEQIDFTAPVKGNEVDYIIDLEDGTIAPVDAIRLTAWLMRSGMLGGLQGYYHRLAENMMNQGFILNRAGEVDFERVEVGLGDNGIGADKVLGCSEIHEVQEFLKSC